MCLSIEWKLYTCRNSNREQLILSIVDRATHIIKTDCNKIYNTTLVTIVFKVGLESCNYEPTLHA